MFKKVRIKLTAWYLLIIMSISVLFSGAIYQMMSFEIDRFARVPRLRIEQRIVIDEEMIDEAKNRLLLNLAGINGIILVVSGSLGYFLAGKTLKPIAKNIEEQTRFIADASHEIRTPLTALMLDFEVALRDKKMDLREAKKIINEGLDEGRKLKKLSDSLLELVNNKNVVMVKEKFNLEEVINEALKKIKGKNIKISKKILVKEMLGVKDKIEELLVILIDNAVKYGKNKVKIEAKKVNNQIKIIVSDDGIGISKEDLPHIFDRFYRADNARSKNGEGGYGLGLAIAKKIIEEHKGKIEVESEAGKGSKFKLVFPN
jgi:two-component system sensor histidine kinase CiaH